MVTEISSLVLGVGFLGSSLIGAGSFTDYRRLRFLQFVFGGLTGLEGSGSRDTDFVQIVQNFYLDQFVYHSEMSPHIISSRGLIVIHGILSPRFVLDLHMSLKCTSIG